MKPEVIVVGAGPAGSAAAYFLADRGRRVLLLDRSRFPRDKSCGDGLTLPAVRILDEMGVLSRLENACKVAGVRVLMRGKGSRDFLYPVGKVTPDYGLVIPRLYLDQAICQRAVEAGAELWEQTLAVQLIHEDGRVIGVEARRNGSTEQLFAPIIVAADGAASRLAAQAGLAKGAAQRFGFAIRGYYSEIDGLEDLLEIFMPLMDPSDRYVLPSYAWVFPTGRDSANIGVGIFQRGHEVTVRDLMDRFLGELRATDPRFRRMQECGRWRGAPLSFEFRPECCVTPGLLLVGDAAGMVSPFTGEGISYALESGKLAAEAIARNLRADGCPPDLTDYALMVEKRFLGYFEAGRRGARRHQLVWHALESTFMNEKPLFALCRKAALFPEAIGEPHASKVLDDVSPLIDGGGLRVREDLLAVGEVLMSALRKEWPSVARFSASGYGDPGIPFRPALLLLLAAAFGNARDARLIPAASAVELGYLAALAHLSVDEEETLASPTHGGDRPANWGNMLALIVGDFFLSKGYELSASVGAEVSQIIAESLAIVCEGRIRREQIASQSDVPDEEYEGVVTREIATLFELPCQLGAILGELPKGEIEILRRYGRNLGLAFHFADQVLDLYGRASELGRATCAGFREGAYTVPVRLALRHSSERHLEQLLAQKPLSNEAAIDVVTIIEDCGAADECLARARAYTARAQAAIKGLAAGPARRTLTRLAEFAVNREVSETSDLHRLL